MKRDFDITMGTWHHPLPDGFVDILGSAESVTPSAHLVEMGAHRVLIDCGIRSGKEEHRLSELASGVEAVILTHAHNDHIAGLPSLIEAGFDGPIYGHGATLEIAEVLLCDGLKLGRASRGNIRGFKERFSKQARPVRYENRRPLESSNEIEFSLHEAGHILGSASIDLRSPKSRVVFSGDLGRPGSPILRDFNTVWSRDRVVDLVVLESTYGDTEHDEAPEAIADKLEAAIQHALRDGGHILVPAFAIGRTQVILYHLNTLVESGRLGNLPVAVDTPLGLKVTTTHRHFRKIFDRESLAQIAAGDDPLDFDNLYAVPSHKASVRLKDIEQPTLIIAGSGMCTGGRITGHLEELLPKKETCVLFVGYQARGTTGREIQDIAEGKRGGTVWINGEDIPVNAEVTTIHGISAHADRQELARWLDAIPRVQKLALNHGDLPTQRSFKNYLAASR